MVEWLAGNRISGTTAERPALSLASPSVGGWKEIARATLGSAAGNLSSGTFTAKKYLWLQYFVKGNAVGRQKIQFNGDTGSNYNFRYSGNGASDGDAGGAANNINATYSNANNDKFGSFFIVNNSGNEKLLMGSSMETTGTGASNVPNRTEVAGKWSNTSSQITSINLWADGGGSSFGTGTEVVVFGWDNTDTHTTNSWEELYSNELSSNNQEFSTGTISAKKYLWLQFYQQGHTGNTYLRFNADSGGNYNRTHSINGASDANVTSQSQLTNVLTGGTGDHHSLTNMFIVNTSDKVKLMTFMTAFNAGSGSGASNAPQHIEGACQWANTSAQITSVQVTDNGGAGFDTGSIFKIWGHD